MAKGTRTRTFTRTELEEWGLPYEADGDDCRATELHCEQVDTRRWVSVHELVFRAPDDGKAYRVAYVQGLTEHQDTEPWEYEDYIMGTEVELAKVIKEVWQPVTVGGIVIV